MITFGGAGSLAVASGESVPTVVGAGTELLAVVSAQDAGATRTARFARMVARLEIVDIVAGRVFAVERVFALRVANGLLALVVRRDEFVRRMALQRKVARQAAGKDLRHTCLQTTKYKQILFTCLHVLLFMHLAMTQKLPW